jgi:hypothetical protein
MTRQKSPQEPADGLSPIDQPQVPETISQPLAGAVLPRHRRSHPARMGG